VTGPEPFVPTCWSEDRYQRASCRATRTTGTSTKIGALRLKLDANTRAGARPNRESRWNFEDNPGGSDRRRRGNAHLLRVHDLRRGATTDDSSVPWGSRRSGKYDIVEL